jgi:hypothetical protein
LRAGCSLGTQTSVWGSWRTGIVSAGEAPSCCELRAGLSRDSANLFGRIASRERVTDFAGAGGDAGVLQSRWRFAWAVCAPRDRRHVCARLFAPASHVSQVGSLSSQRVRVGSAPWSLSHRQLSALAGMLCPCRVLKVRRCACLFRLRMTRVALVAGSIAPDDARKVQYTREQVDACGDPFEVVPSVPAPIRRVRQLFIVDWPRICASFGRMLARRCSGSPRRLPQRSECSEKMSCAP